MLTPTQIDEVARFLDQTGEPREGYLLDGPDGVSGPVCVDTAVTGVRGSSGVTVRFQLEEDRDSGGLDLIQL